jgi:hypothetical protein
MGLLSGLLGLPLAPVKGTIAIADQVLRQAEEQYYDPRTIRAELRHVAQLREEGQISPEEAEAWEDGLVERLMVGNERARKDRHG